jgi:hypothetical protein
VVRDKPLELVLYFRERLPEIDVMNVDYVVCQEINVPFIELERIGQLQ